jgi:hypothetical protein
MIMDFERRNARIRNNVIPAQAGIQRSQTNMDPRIRGDDEPCCVDSIVSADVCAARRTLADDGALDEQIHHRVQTAIVDRVGACGLDDRLGMIGDADIRLP